MINTFTKEQIIDAITDIVESLYDQDLYATKEIIDLIRDELPYNVKPVEVPDGFLPDSGKVYLIKRNWVEDYFGGRDDG